MIHLTEPTVMLGLQAHTCTVMGGAYPAGAPVGSIPAAHVL